MISRRGFFGMLAGLATSPLFGQKVRAGSFRPAKTNGTFHETVAHPATYRFLYTNGPPPISKDWRIFRCGTGEMGTLYWSKENS